MAVYPGASDVPGVGVGRAPAVGEAGVGEAVGVVTTPAGRVSAEGGSTEEEGTDEAGADEAGTADGAATGRAPASSGRDGRTMTTATATIATTATTASPR